VHWHEPLRGLGRPAEQAGDRGKSARIAWVDSLPFVLPDLPHVLAAPRVAAKAGKGQ
jgi:hypothetical protein